MVSIVTFLGDSSLAQARVDCLRSYGIPPCESQAVLISKRQHMEYVSITSRQARFETGFFFWGMLEVQMSLTVEAGLYTIHSGNMEDRRCPELLYANVVVSR